MTADQFITRITKSGNLQKIRNITMQEQVVIQTNLTAIGIIIENCTFNEGVFIESIDLSCGIRFVNCTFKKNLSLNNCTASSYDQVFNFYNFHLEFKNTKIDGLYFDGLNQIERGISICEKSEINRLVVRTLISNKGCFAINDSTIETLFDVSQAQISNEISIRENCIINANVRFENISSGSIVFTGSTFKKNIHIWAGKIGSLTFNDGLFEDDLHIKAVTISSYLTIYGTEFKKSIDFILKDSTNNKTGALTNVYIKSGKFGEQFIINGRDCQIEELIIDTSKQLEGDLYFNNCKILKAKLTGNNYNSNIVFNHSYFNNLSFDFFNNYSTLSLISVKAFNQDSVLTIAHSNLGKTHLFNAYLDSFGQISIYNSVLTEIIIANVKWFEDKNLNPNISVTSHDYTYKKEIYRQLKFALEKQGDRISSLNFKSLEMSAYKNESFAKVEWYKRLFSVDRFILWVGQTNNFGQNWLKPIGFAVGFTLLFYFLIVIGISDKLNYNLNFSKESIEITRQELCKYSNIIPQLLNPVNSLSKVLPENINLSFLVNTWDYLLKICLAFFIFQIVSAFRKYMK